MLRRYFNLLKSYSKVQRPCYSISSRVIVHCLNTKGHISYNNYNIQVHNFHESVVNRSQLSSNTLEEKIINLCIHLRNGRISLDDVESIVDIYEKTDYEMRNEISLILLKCCGELLPNVDIKTRQMLTKRVWDIIQKKDDQLTLEHYHNLLVIYEQNSELINLTEFLSNMKVEPNESIYCCLLNVAIKTGDSESVSNIMSKLKENIHSWNESTFNTIIEVHAMQGNITEAYNMIKQMKSSDIEPSSETYIHLAYGFAKMGDIANVIQICEKNQPSTANVIKIIRILRSSGYSKDISSILKFLPGSLEDELSIINNTIIELVHSGQSEDALKIISYLLPTDTEILEGCIEFVKYFVNKEIQLGTSDEDILLVIHKFMHNKYFTQIIKEATKIALCHGKETLALTLFENMRQNNIPIRPHYYYPLLKQAHKSQNEDKIYSLISHMISLNVEIDDDTLNYYILPFVDVKDPIELARKIINIGINYTTVISCLAAFLLHNNRLTDVISMLSEFRLKCNFNEPYLKESLIEGFRINTNLLNYVKLLLQIPFKTNPPYLYILNALIDDANNSKEVKQLIEFLELLKEYDVTLSTIDTDFIKERINKIEIDKTENEIIENLLDDMHNKEVLQKSFENVANKSKSILSNLPHPVNMGAKELEAHVIELKSKNMKFRGSFKKLLQAHCMNNDLKAAEEVKEQILSNNFEWTPGMSAFLFQLYLRNNILDKAEIELNEITTKFNTFMVDSSKILTYAICLVKNNRLEDAFDVINNFKNVAKSLNDSIKCHWLLREIAKSEHEDKLEEMMIALVKNKYCTIDTYLLAPFIIRHLENNDIDSAIESFEYCAMKYKKCPLKQKLLLEILKENDSSVAKKRLLKVVECIHSVHGEQVSLIQLLMAFATSGDVVKLQTIFELKDINADLFYHNVRKYEKTNEVDTLLTIFKGTKNIARVPKQPLCDLIITVYEKKKDYEGVKEFLKMMKDADIKPTKHFQEKISLMEEYNKKYVELRK